MLKKIKNFVIKTDRFLFKKFGSEKNIKYLESSKEAKLIFSCLNDFENDTKVKFVGGCVRKALYGEIIDDIDLATTLEPNEAKERLRKNNIKVIDTGIEHGTITAIVNKKSFEITTLRKDISTDGRHAKVEYTKDWNEDAKRRDLTINSIYASIDGQIFDPHNGIEDLYNGKIKFIGLPEERIQEDYLRILRYFRFFVQYSKVDHENNIIKYIKKNINGLNLISKERIFEEIKKTLSLKNFNKLFSNENSKEIILNIFPQFKYYERLRTFNKLDNRLKIKFDYTLILALLIVDQTDNYEFFCYKYKTSNLIKNRCKNIFKHFENLNNKKFYSEENLKKLIYFIDKDNVTDLLLFSTCVNKYSNKVNIEKLLKFVKNCKKPKFPITGEDLKNYGYESGKELGKKLKKLEEEWIQNNFIIKKQKEELIKKN